MCESHRLCEEVKVSMASSFITALPFAAICNSSRVLSPEEGPSVVESELQRGVVVPVEDRVEERVEELAEVALLGRRSHQTRRIRKRRHASRTGGRGQVADSRLALSRASFPRIGGTPGGRGEESIGAVPPLLSPLSLFVGREARAALLWRCFLRD
jgi:hypothetical protein